jgi:4-coumarate--CoA ligase
LENVIREIPGVVDVAVIGVSKDDEEVPRAYIVKNDKNLTEAGIHQFVDGKVASFKRLKGGIEFIEAIPKSSAGKILRNDLLALYRKTENGQR